jgi:hypothetical protein
MEANRPGSNTRDVAAGIFGQTARQREKIK